MRGGKYLNNKRMAELHAKESTGPRLGARAMGRALRPDQGRKILQATSAYRYARLAHVGRTGLELIRTPMQQKVVSMATDVFMECKVLKLVHDDGGRIAGCGRLLEGDG